MRSDRRWGARVELTIRYLAILVPLLLVFGVALELWLRDELERRARGDLEREVELVLEVARREGSASTDRAELARRLESALVFIEHPTRVTDASGQLARSRRAMVEDQLRDFFMSHSGKQGLIAAAFDTAKSRLAQAGVELAAIPAGIAAADPWGTRLRITQA